MNDRDDARPVFSAVCVVWCVVAVSGCGGLDVDAVGPTRLAATDPALIESAGAIVFTWSSTTGCSSLITADAAELDDVVNREADPSVQRVPMLRGQIDPNRGSPNFVDGAATHTFGEVPSSIPIALLAVAVDRDPGDGFALDDLDGSIFAVACRDLTLEPGKRVEVPLVLAPVGLR